MDATLRAPWFWRDNSIYIRNSEFGNCRSTVFNQESNSTQKKKCKGLDEGWLLLQGSSSVSTIYLSQGLCSAKKCVLLGATLVFGRLQMLVVNVENVKRLFWSLKYLKWSAFVFQHTCKSREGHDSFQRDKSVFVRIRRWTSDTSRYTSDLVATVTS